MSAIQPHSAIGCQPQSVPQCHWVSAIQLQGGFQPCSYNAWVRDIQYKVRVNTISRPCCRRPCQHKSTKQLHLTMTSTRLPPGSITSMSPTAVGRCMQAGAGVAQSAAVALGPYNTPSDLRFADLQTPSASHTSQPALHQSNPAAAPRLLPPAAAAAAAAAPIPAAVPASISRCCAWLDAP